MRQYSIITVQQNVTVGLQPEIGIGATIIILRKQDTIFSEIT